MTLTEQLAKQATRTVASKTIRRVAKQHVPTNSIIYKMGVSALIAGVGHMITKGIPKSTTPTLLDDGMGDTLPDEFEMTEEEIADIMNKRMLKIKDK